MKAAPHRAVGRERQMYPRTRREMVSRIVERAGTFQGQSVFGTLGGANGW